MTARYSIPPIESIQEDSENELNGSRLVKRTHFAKETSYRIRRLSSTAAMGSKDVGKEREKGQRKHRGRKHQSKRDDVDPKQASTLPRGNNGRPQMHHKRTLSNRSTSSTSSSSDEEEKANPNHRVMLQRNKLSSPSVVSTITTLTTTTNNSSGSSGSNSTVTQASITRRSSEKRPELPETSVAPAVPDAPDVFAFLDTGSTVSVSDKEDEDTIEEQMNEEKQSDEDIRSDDDNEVSNEDYMHNQDDVSDEEDVSNKGQRSQWPSHKPYDAAPLPPTIPPDQHHSSSSPSSSFHDSDHLSEPSAESADNDTDRSTSPERSADSRSDHSDHDGKAATISASVKIASQMAAAQQRQGQYTVRPPSHPRTSNLTQSTAFYPYMPTHPEMGPRYPQPPPTQRGLPRPEKMLVTGYELLATRLSHASTNSEDGEKIKPMYRKFEALNHRVLLHLQDELVELEERLRRIDHLDTEARQASFDGTVVPASRRAAQASGKELDWHKTDVLGRIGFKLDQYNRALTTFNATQGLNPPDPVDVHQYREYLSTEHPIAESETRFLDPTDDLVSVSSEKVPRYAPSLCSETQTYESSAVAVEPADPTSIRQQLPLEPGLSGLAMIMAVAVLGPILTSSVIPGFVGRMAVVGLVSGLIFFAFMHVSAVSGNTLSRDSLLCAGIYGGAMIVIAGIMG